MYIDYRNSIILFQQGGSDMKIFTSYSVRINHYSHIFKDTVNLYRSAVDMLIEICLNEWEDIVVLKGHEQLTFIETLMHSTKDHPTVKYPEFDKRFYKFPSYLRRGAVNEAIGKVSSYKSNLANWEEGGQKIRGKRPSLPRAGNTFPCMYRTNMYEQTGLYEAKIKVFIRNTWDWLPVQLKKSDMDYISRHCALRRQCPPALVKRGRQWLLEFPFEENVTLNETDIFDQTIIAVDLGINNAATISVMNSEGTVTGRHFLKLPGEYDSLTHAVNRIKKAQQHGNRKTPRLWAKAKGINDDIAVKTARFIMDIAIACEADTIVFEHLDTGGKKHGSKKQRLHMWRSSYVQNMVTDKAHRMGMRISRICAWGTSRYAFDGSGAVMRGKDAGFPSYSICRFKSGKVYNCDLNASYNIGARYFIREILKSLPARERLALEAKVPQAAKRSTCTLSVLINLNAELMAVTA